MEEKKLRITLRICNKEYPIRIDPEKEELHRLAANTVNAIAAKYEKMQIEGFVFQDCLAMAAVDLAVKNISLKQSREVGNEDMKQLSDISRQIEEYLNAPEK